jgi:thiosulfate/3-mercaptopyruvate sulfurtransferase
VRYQFVDCRWELGDPGRGRELYLEGHIPGASFLDVERDLSLPPGPGGRHPLPSAEQFAEAAGRAGIGDGVFVVTYGSMGGAERLWWLLRHFGHGDCAVIELAGWLGPLRSGEEEVAAAEFTPRPRTGDTIDAEELRERLNDLVLLDARVPERYRGDVEPIDPVAGHIPGALNVPWNEPLGPRRLPDGELVAYCGSGVTATVLVHRLALTGRDAKLYAGSWSEWSGLGLPAESGS